MPSAGHYSDMQTLMQNMETLSGWLQQNREDFLSVQDGLEQVERRNVGLSFDELGSELAVRAIAEDQSSDTVIRPGTPQVYLHFQLSMENHQNTVCLHLPHVCSERISKHSRTLLVTNTSQQQTTLQHLPSHHSNDLSTQRRTESKHTKKPTKSTTACRRITKRP